MFGMFENTEETYVGVSASRVISDEAIKNTLVKAAIYSIFGSTDLVDEVINLLTTNLVSRVESNHNHSKSTAYYYGSPTGEYISRTGGRDQAQAILTAQTGQNIVFDYYFVGPANILHIGWMKLISDYGYNPVTNTLYGGASVGNGMSAIYLQDMFVVIPEARKSQYSAAALSQYGTPPSAGLTPTRKSVSSVPGLSNVSTFSPVLTRNVQDDFAEAQLVYTSSDYDQYAKHRVEIAHFTTLNIPNNEYLDGIQYAHAKYTLNGVPHYWIYAIGSGGHPTIDAAVSQPQPVYGDYFPFIHFRRGFNSIKHEFAALEYASSVRMCKNLGIDYDNLLSSVESNEHIGDIHDVFMMQGFQANTTNSLEIGYLFQYFDRIADSYPAMQEVAVGVRNVNEYKRYAAAQNHYIDIKDTKARMAIGFNAITKTKVVGAIGPIGTCTATFVPRSHTYGVANVNGVSTGTYTEKASQHIYRKQITEHVYEVITVHALHMLYPLSGAGETATSTNGESAIIIPLDKSITDLYSNTDREVLYARSFHLICVSRHVESLAWYEQEWFGFALQIVAVSILVISVGSAANEAYAAWAAAEAVSLTAATIAVLEVIAIFVIKNITISYALRKVTKELGIKGTVIAAALAAYYGYDSAGSAGILSCPSAMQYLKLSIGLIQAEAANIREDIQDVMDEIANVRAQYADQMKTLEDAQKLLEEPVKLEPFIFIGEKPDDYYNRTVHSGNIGLAGIDIVHSYVESALTLPTISETLKGA